VIEPNSDKSGSPCPNLTIASWHRVGATPPSVYRDPTAGDPHSVARTEKGSTSIRRTPRLSLRLTTAGQGIAILVKESERSAKCLDRGPTGHAPLEAQAIFVEWGADGLRRDGGSQQAPNGDDGGRPFGSRSSRNCMCSASAFRVSALRAGLSPLPGTSARTKAGSAAATVDGAGTRRQRHSQYGPFAYGVDSCLACGALTWLREDPDAPNWQLLLSETQNASLKNKPGLVRLSSSRAAHQLPVSDATPERMPLRGSALLHTTQVPSYLDAIARTRDSYLVRTNIGIDIGASVLPARFFLGRASSRARRATSTSRTLNVVNSLASMI
jgi:hypothetical protein